MALKDWTIMVYLGADNNLGQEMIWALKDIYKAQSELGYDIKVVALYDGGGLPRRFDPQADQPQRLEDFKKRNGGRSTGKDLYDGAILDLSDGELKNHMTNTRQSGCGGVESIEDTLKNFILKTITNDSANHYMLVLSGHGSGVVGEFLPARKRLFGLTIPTLREVLKSVREKLKDIEGSKKINILGLDACEMSMTEVAYEVREEVDFVIGAEGFQPNIGWPYDRVLEIFKTKLEPDEICKEIVKDNIKFYLDYTTADVSVDSSAIASGKITGLTKELQGFTQPMTSALTEFAQALEAGLEERKKHPAFVANIDIVDAIVLARRDAQGYKNEQFVDLWDFCDLLFNRLERLERLAGQSKEQKERLTNVKTACKKIKDAIAPEKEGEGLVISAAYTGAAFQHSHGVSIYFPWTNLTDAAGISDVAHYEQLSFAKDSKWDEFIHLFHLATIRDLRTTHTKPPARLSLLNRRTGLFTGVPGSTPGHANHRDPEVSTEDRTNVGKVRIESMKNPPIAWREYEF